MTPRYSQRIPVKAPVMFKVGSVVGEGHVLNLTHPGCLIVSPVVVKRGDYLQLKLFLPELASPLSVTLAAVRWTNGSQFGVEFIKMDEQDRQVLNRVAGQHSFYAAPIAQHGRPRFSESAGQNWHLTTYSGL